MFKKDWSHFAPPAAVPSRSEIAKYRRWRKYLADSKLDIKTQHERAAAYAEGGHEPPVE